MNEHPQDSKKVRRDAKSRASHAPQPSQRHLDIEEKEGVGRPPRSDPRSTRTDVPVTSHDEQASAKGVNAPQEKAGR